MPDVVTKLIEETLHVSDTLFCILKHANYYQQDLTKDNDLLKSVMIVTDHGISCRMQHGFGNNKLMLQTTVLWLNDIGVIDPDVLLETIKRVHMQIITEIDRLKK